MAYATTAELAAALRVTVSSSNQGALAACLDAATAEIDAALDRDDSSLPLTDDQLALVGRVNLVRGVEFWKANDTAFGVLGTADTGTLMAPRNSFNRHRSTLRPLKERFGVG